MFVDQLTGSLGSDTQGPDTVIMKACSENVLQVVFIRCCDYNDSGDVRRSFKQDFFRLSLNLFTPDFELAEIFYNLLTLPDPHPASYRDHLLGVHSILLWPFFSRFSAENVSVSSLSQTHFSTEELHHGPLPPTLPPPLTVTVVHKLRWVYFTLTASSAFTLYSRDAMRLTLLFFCGTLFAFSSLSWTSSDALEGSLPGGQEFGPCAASLTPEGPCRHGQDDSTCPYVFNLPPLTVHLPEKLKELEKIMNDLQELQDNVDQLRKMCADCTASQSERVCGRQKESRYGKLTTVKEANNRMKESTSERLEENDRDLTQGCRTDRLKPEKTVEGESHSGKKIIMEEKERKNWEAESENDRVVAGADSLRDVFVDKKNEEADRDKEKDGKGYLKRDEEEELDNGTDRKIIKETEKKTKTEEDDGRDRIKMSEDHDRHTNKEGEQHGEERKKETGIKVERNNEKPKQTESIGLTEKETIKGGEVEEHSEMGEEMKTEGEEAVESEQRDSGEELASSKASQSTNFVLIRPTPRSTDSRAHRPDSLDFDETITVTSSPPSLPLSSSYEGVAEPAYAVPTQSTYFQAPGITEHRSPYEESGLRNSSLDGHGQKLTSGNGFTTTVSMISAVHSQDGVSSTIATSATSKSRQNFYTTVFPGASDQRHRTGNNNISSNPKTGVKPTPDRGHKPEGKHKPGIKPEAEHKLKDSKNDHKPDQGPSPGKKTKQDQKHKPSPRKHTADQTSKPGKERVRIPKPDHHLHDNLQTDQNLPKRNRNGTTNLHQTPIQDENRHQKSSPVQNPSPRQRPATVNTTSSDKQPDSDQITKLNQNSQLDKRPKSEEKTKPDSSSKSNRPFTYFQEPERRETIRPTSRPDRNPVTRLMGSNDPNLSPEPKSVKDSTPAQQPTDNHDNKPPDQNNISRQKIPKHPKFITNKKTKPNVKPEPDQAPQSNPGLKNLQPDSNLNPKPASDPIPDAGSNKTSQRWHPPRHGPPTRPGLKPGATPAERPKQAELPKPSPKTNTHLDPPLISRTINIIQYPNTDMPPTSSPAKPTHGLTHSSEDTQFNPSTMKAISQDPKTSNNLEAGPFPQRHALAEGFTKSPNSRILSDLRPQTASQPSSIPMTTNPNKIHPGTLRGVNPSTHPESTKPNLSSNGDVSLQAKVLHTEEETTPSKVTTPIPSPSAPTTSTVSSDFRSTTSATSGPGAPTVESSTPSARELRVKIDQVAAFFNHSAIGRPPDRHPKENKQGGSRPHGTDSKPPTHTPAKGKRDCFIQSVSDHV